MANQNLELEGGGEEREGGWMHFALVPDRVRKFQGSMQHHYAVDSVPSTGTDGFMVNSSSVALKKNLFDKFILGDYSLLETGV